MKEAEIYEILKKYDINHPHYKVFKNDETDIPHHFQYFLKFTILSYLRCHFLHTSMPNTCLVLYQKTNNLNFCFYSSIF